MARPIPRQDSFADAELRQQSAGRNSKLETIAKLLDSRRQLIEKVAADLRKGLKKPGTGRTGLNPFQVLRAFVLQRIENLDLRSLSERIADGISWRIFTGFDAQPVPRHHAFNRAFNRLRAETVRQINDEVVNWAVEAGLENGKRARVDTTVVETDIRFPSDSSLLWDCVRVITREVKRLGEDAPKAVRGFKDHTRRARRRFQEITRMTRRQRHQQQLPKYRDLLTTTQQVLFAARIVLPKARKKADSCADLMRGIRIRAACDMIEHYCSLADRVVNQTRRRVLEKEQVPVAEKTFSIFEPHTDCIVRGKAQKPVEFGHKVFLAESGNGLITDYGTLDGNPPDETHVGPTLDRHQGTFGKAPDIFAGDRGFYSLANLDLCREAGVKIESIPQRGGSKTAEREAYEKTRVFKQAQRFRAGVEGRISVLMRGRGMRRCLSAGRSRFEVFVGMAVLANNLLILAELLRKKEAARRKRAA
ncbi:MAG TPA: ISNCY family transposase [Thermoleophilia bacterium]|nr:ISNCY family transposase [Thermoleophilia bacterium]